MYNLRYDKNLNRIFVTIEDDLGNDEASCYVKETVGFIEKAFPGFSAMIDLRKCSLNVLYNIGGFSAVRAAAARNKAGKVVYILNEDTKKLHSIKPFEGLTYTFTDKTEAEHFLNKD